MGIMKNPIINGASKNPKINKLIPMIVYLFGLNKNSKISITIYHYTIFFLSIFSEFLFHFLRNNTSFNLILPIINVIVGPWRE